MVGNFKKNDLRIAKTYKALLDSLFTLVERRSFTRVTVNDLCAEAQISRPTFYAHFKDKYDLLEYWLTNLKSEMINAGAGNGCIKEGDIINLFIRDNTKTIINLLKDADDETLELLRKFIISCLDIPAEKDDNGNLSQRYIVVSNFCAGGMLNLLFWQVKNKFPADIQMFNIYLHEILEFLLDKK